MTEPKSRPNPFPGLRPYEPDEDHLFFGREKETDDLLRRLASARFVPVIGTSGCGKSSLVRCGLIPALQSGYMVRAGSSWRVAVMRPGEDPIGHLAAALDAPSVLASADREFGDTNRVMLEATLRRGSLGLVAAVQQAHLPEHDNVLIVVDQFEELFRYRATRSAASPHARDPHVAGSADAPAAGRRDDAVAFVKLLIEATRRQTVPVYVVLTMRSDFLGDCMEFPGLPEAINESHYLVPRMTRDELRSAITGPISVAGGAITPRLVARLLNELGDMQDDLPLLQHVLMRMWNHTYGGDGVDRPIDLADYVAVGTLRDALSIHADEAYAEAEGTAGAAAIERLFRALTDTVTDPRGIRRPTPVAELAAIARLSESEVMQVVEIFRRDGRSFLMPPPSVPLTPSTVIDISHESLMRGWRRLIDWAQQERAAAAIYTRLSREAMWWEEGAAGLWGDPELELGLRWRRENSPTAAWAARYDEGFERAMRFLDLSEQERARQRAERHAMRVRNLQIAWGVAAILLIAFVVAVWQGLVARRENARAEANLRLAAAAVDQLLASVDRNPAVIGADFPQVAELRRELLERARTFYSNFLTQQPRNEEFLREMAAGHYRLGHIHRMLVDPETAAREFRESIAQFTNLSRDHPDNRDYQQALGNAYNWLGETLRPTAAAYEDALRAYDSAVDVQTRLVQAAPETAEYQQELARTRYNRGILFANGPAADGAARAADDFTAAIRSLEEVVQRTNAEQARQDLSRVYNNFAVLRSGQPDGLTDAKTYYARAIELHEMLVAAAPDNREYRSELATFSNNYSYLLRQFGELDAAKESSARAIVLLNDLVRPAPTLGIEQADAHDLRGGILQAEGSPEATAEYQQAFQLFRDLEPGGADRLPAYHERFGDLLLNVASLAASQPGRGDVQRLLDAIVGYYADLGVRSAADRPAIARTILANLQGAMDQLPPSARSRWEGSIRTLEQVVMPASSGR